MSYLFKLTLFLFLAACSLQSRKDQAQIREYFKLNETDKAFALLEKSEFKTEEKNKLLYLLNKGRILYAKEEFKSAADVFVEASELVDKLYTKSVREALLTSIASNNNESFYGSPYERSLLFYYQALSFLKIYENGFIQSKDEKNKLTRVELTSQERKRYLFRARASAVAWDTFYKELQRSSRESTKFDHDLFAKMMGAKIHELVGERQDQQIALQLYQDAYELLEKSAPVFFSFNTQAMEFLTGENEKEKPVVKSEQYQKTKDYIAYKILSLAKKRQRWKFSKLKKKLKPSKAVLDKIAQKNNTTILIESGLIAPLKAESVSYNLRSAIENVDNPAAATFIAAVGVPVLTYFAMGPLGLGAVKTRGDQKIYFRHSAGEAMTAEAGIEFEIPIIERPVPTSLKELVVYNVEGESEKVVKKIDLSMIGPISDLAFNINRERVKASFSKRGARIAVKHVLAIISAFKTYQIMKEKHGETFARPAAFAQYLVLAKAIRETECADTRQWGILPSEVLMAEADIPPGTYKLRLVDKADSKIKRELGDITIQAEREAFFTYSAP